MKGTLIPASRPLSHGQLQIWAGQQRDPQSPLYNMALVSTIEGAVDAARFERAWQSVLRRFPQLQEAIVVRDGEPFAASPVAGSSVAAPALECIDLADAREPADAAQALVRQRCTHALDLTGRLVDAVLLRLSSRQWRFYCNIHHIVCDAASFGVLWRCLAADYDEDRALPGPVATDSDDALVTAEADEAESHAPGVSPAVCDGGTASDDPSTAHWQARARPLPLDLYGSTRAPATTRSTRAIPDTGAAWQAALQRLTDLPQARSFSARMAQSTVIATSLFAWLHRITGESALTIGVLTSLRQSAREREALGLFVEILPVTVDVADGETFAGLMQKVRDEMLLALRHAAPGASRCVSQGDIHVVLNVVTASLGHFGALPAQHEWLHPGHADRQHAVRLHVTDWSGEGRPSLAFDLNAARFDDAGRQLAINHWQACFDAMSHDPQGRIGDVVLSASDPTPMVLVPDTPRRASDSVLGRIRDTAHRCPDTVAIRHDSHTLTYRELMAQADHIAQALAAAGAGPGSRVAIHLPRGLALMPAILGVMACGAAWVPIDTSQPPARMQQILSDSAVTLVIANSASNSPVTGGCAVLSVHDLLAADPVPSQDASLAAVGAAPADPAYILYTSGSTGTPKGVVVSNGAMLNYCAWAADFYCSGEALAFALFTSIGFDLTITSMFVPLMTGGSIRVYPEKPASLELAVLDVFDDDAVDIVKLTPAHLSLLQGRDLRHSRIRQLIVGGEDFKSALARSIHDASGGRLRQHNEYGPTEATVGCIVHTFDALADTAESVPIGHPVAGTTARLLNAHGRRQPAGVIGELYLGGPSLADGYWQREALTAERFVADPFAPQRRLYKTGDLARQDRSGRLVYLGRADEQIKIRGVRIEPAEIEAAALAHPAISACVTTLATVTDTPFEQPERHCTRCGVSSRSPGLSFDDAGVCLLCTRFERYRSRAGRYFREMAELEAVARQMRATATGRWHCMMLLSGGKDSTYALARLVDLGLSVLAFTLDNGYISESAKANIERVCRALGVEHRYGSTPAMNAIFADSLNRHANVCNGCFKTIYTLSMRMARDLQIPWVFTGLSRGQFFETRLTEELFTADDFDVDTIDDLVLRARKAYHRVDDAIARLLDTGDFQHDAIFEQVRFIDFYRYCPATLDEVLAYLDTRLPWVRPTDTGRSTNCLINDVGIHVHKLERGFHNYSLPYSWDVRLGHKQRDAALAELNDHIDEQRVNDILETIGYTPKPDLQHPEQRLALYYVASTDSVAPEALRQWLADRLPAAMMPTWLIGLPALPLSANGKVMKSALPTPGEAGTNRRPYAAPQTDLQATMAARWAQMLSIARVGIDDNFFELGGDSLLAIRIAARLNADGLVVRPTDLFDHQTIRALSNVATVASPEVPPDRAPRPERFATVSRVELDKLRARLGRSGPS